MLCDLVSNGQPTLLNPLSYRILLKSAISGDMVFRNRDNEENIAKIIHHPLKNKVPSQHVEKA